MVQWYQQFVFKVLWVSNYCSCTPYFMWNIIVSSTNYGNILSFRYSFLLIFIFFLSPTIHVKFNIHLLTYTKLILLLHTFKICLVYCDQLFVVAITVDFEIKKSYCFHSFSVCAPLWTFLSSKIRNGYQIDVFKLQQRHIFSSPSSNCETVA